MSTINRNGMVRFGDASLTVTEEPGRRDHKQWTVFEKEFKAEVFTRIVQQLNRLGFSMEIPQESIEQYKCIANTHRQGRHGDLECFLDITGRCIKLKFWQSVANITREDGNGQYEFDKESKMPYLIRIRMEHARQTIKNYLCNVFTGYVFEAPKPKLGPGGVDADGFIKRVIKATGHYVPELGHARIGMGCNQTSRDKKTIKHGDFVYAIGSSGRIIYGQAFYDLNSTWLVKTGRFDVSFIQASDIYCENPGDLRCKRNERRRRYRLESELSKAIKVMDFQRADILKKIIFGGEPLFYLVSKRDGLYWRPNESGYTSNQIEAGKYTTAEVRHYQDSSDVKIVSVAA